MSRRFRICMAKGGRESARPSYGRPKLTLIPREKKITLGGVTKTWPAAILTLEQNPLERKFLCTLKIFSQEDFALKSKLWPWYFFQHRPTFAGNSRSTGISQLWAGKTQSKRPRVQFLPICIAIILSFMTHHNIFPRFRARGRRVKKFHFSQICVSPW